MSPLAVGAVALLDVRWAALLIAAWNVFSGVAEYWMLLRVWHAEPTLHVRPPASDYPAKLERSEGQTPKPAAAAASSTAGLERRSDAGDSKKAPASVELRAARQNSSRAADARTRASSGVPSERQTAKEADAKEKEKEKEKEEKGSEECSLADPLEVEVPLTEDVGASPYAKGTTLSPERAAAVSDTLERQQEQEQRAKDAASAPLTARARRLVRHLLHSPRTLLEGWRAYVRQSALFASLAMALLYLTVLSWDSLTISYAVAQGVPAWLCALVNALSAITGIVRSTSTSHFHLPHSTFHLLLSVATRAYLIRNLELMLMLIVM